MTERIAYVVGAAVLSVLVALNLSAGRIGSSMISIERRKQPYGFWAVVGLQCLGSVGLLCLALWGRR